VGLKIKWLLVSAMGGVLITAILFFFSEKLVIDVPPSVEAIAKVALWPVVLCEHLVGPGPSFGPPEKHHYEGTPLHFLAAVVGVGLSWVFYSSLVFLLVRYRSHGKSGQ
jgi:hypothetical protein